MPKEEEEPRIAFLKQELEAAQERIRFLEKENEQLKQDLALVKSQTSDRKSVPWRKLQNSVADNNNTPPENPTAESKIVEAPPSCPKAEYSRLFTKERVARVPKPPPKPSFSSQGTLQAAKGMKSPPPPPPPPMRPRGGPASAVRRVPEVMETYRQLTRKDTRADSRTSVAGNPTANARDMIGEIANRSSYLLAIKSEVETQGEFITLLTREVENAAYTEMSDVEAFVKWLDDELSYLVDERAVLKHFPQWPERKADAMREAACTYRDLKNLESEVLSFEDNHHQPSSAALKRMQALQDKLERSVHNLERLRENASKKYKECQIPYGWMLDTGIISQLKLGSIRLAKDYMKRIVAELQLSACIQDTQDEELLLQGVRFAFRVHQFVGGLNADAMTAFQELTKVARDYHLLNNS
ncbi:INCREASED PETAL GROWTH ANISOTROPY 1-like protein 1 [Aristolochia californica]|uniref:INCREASED PETAL GROWTH ANISOTROPY 1-like protein 1 n=1 Tax=Aristolochia californica TaxID=171875 RepID=UPI0035D61592